VRYLRTHRVNAPPTSAIPARPRSAPHCRRTRAGVTPPHRLHTLRIVDFSS